MRKEKTLIALLRGLVDLIAQEAERNPEFGAKVDTLLTALPEQTHPPKATKVKPPLPVPPDIHAEWQARGEVECRLWLRDQPTAVLRAIVRSQDLDPTRRTVKWKEPEKFAEFIGDGLRARLSRGSAFIGKTNSNS